MSDVIKPDFGGRKTVTENDAEYMPDNPSLSHQQAKITELEAKMLSAAINDLPERDARIAELKETVADLSMLVRRLVQSMKYANTNRELQNQAMDYLGRKGLCGDILREDS